MNVLSDLEPTDVFRYFEEICAIPHGSSHTKKISDYLVSFAKSQNLSYLQDTINNVIIFKKGTLGYESSDSVILQGHMDMVCEKDADVEINFETDGLCLQLENGILSAKGTTLGGDDGIAVAYMLALLASDSIPHPPLEAVFTVDEEIGMLGAAALDCSPLKSHILLNLDSEEEGHLLVGCAGGVRASVHLPIQYHNKNGKKILLSIHGLLGGHSGVEIDKGRANACILLGRILYHLKQQIPYDLVSVSGGLKDNAIPREAQAILSLESSTSLEQMHIHIQNLQQIISHEYAPTDSQITLSVCECPPDLLSLEHRVMEPESANKVMTALMNLPNGIQRMSYEIEGLVQTSLNLGILSTEPNEVTLSFALRSNIRSEKEALTEKIICLTETLGGTITLSGDYPAWEYQKDSPLRELMIQVFEEKYGRTPKVEALHAGVECGLFTGKIKGLDCVSFGPDIKNIHTPKESMDVESVKRTWEYLLEILKRLK